MKYLFSMPVSGPLGTPDSMTSLAGQADRLGFEAITASERLVMPRAISSSYPYAETGEVPGVGTVQNTLEMLTVLAFLSAHTARIGLLTSVLVLPYRNPLLTAKMLATIDVLSKGRLIVGCGVGWMREEADTLGVPSAFEDRGAVSDEYIRAFRELWSGDEPDFQGRHLRFSDIEFAPRPVQQPGPPIWIGGESPAAMRRVATLGDGWLPAAGNPRYPLDTPERLADAVARLRRNAEAEGRDPSKVDIGYGGVTWIDGHPHRLPGGERKPFSGSDQQVAEDIETYERLGVTYLSLRLTRPSLTETLERMERFMREVSPLAG